MRRKLVNTEWRPFYKQRRNTEKSRAENKNNTISSIETGQFNPTAKLALALCIDLDKKLEELFYF